METKYYRYPRPIKNAKLSSKFCIFFLALLLIPAILGYIPLKHSEHYLLIIGLILGILGSVFFVGWWADIGIDENGLLVEFFWAKLNVQWNEIVDVKPFGPRFFHLWVVITKNKLTFFHRLYGVYSLKSLKPSFFVFNKYRSHEFLISKIMANIKQ
jgi:hypothetical protein